MSIGETPEAISSQNNPSQNDEFIFAQEDEENASEKFADGESWKVLIVDDDEEVHSVTKLALSDFTFQGKPLSFLSAYSGDEAKQLAQVHPDIALALVDVVMETEDAGLEFVTYVRERLKNQLVRLVLRTGQPGRSPENIVAMNYEIDDYRTKTELTVRKLFVTVVTALRAFSTLMNMLETSQSRSQTVATIESGVPPSGATLEPDPQNLEQNLEPSSLPRQSLSTEKIAALGQLVTEVTHEILDASGQSNTIYTMSLITWIARTVLRVTEERFTKLGISHTKLVTLLYLSAESNLSASPSSLAKHCGVSRAAMTGLLDSLEQEGYVERDDHPFDRRALMIRLTSKGQQFLDSIAPQEQYRVSELMSALTDVERKQLIDLAIQIVQLFEQQAIVSIEGYNDAI
jgi:DNA-binding MarR family transcriptional regulator/CheY-like chemotaxis protein